MVPDLGAANAADYSDASRSYVAQSSVTVALERRRLRFALASASRRSSFARWRHRALQYLVSFTSSAGPARPAAPSDCRDDWGAEPSITRDSPSASKPLFLHQLQALTWAP